MDHDPEIINVENHQPRGEQCHYKWPQQLHVKGSCRLFNTWNYLHTQRFDLYEVCSFTNAETNSVDLRSRELF